MVRRLFNRERLLLKAYELLADLRFIVSVNLGIAAMIWRKVSEEKVDLVMSWATMGMDQIIIAAGWVLVTIGVKHRKEDKAQWNRMERRLELLEKQNAALLQALGIQVSAE
jgi:hypothetical protein